MWARRLTRRVGGSAWQAGDLCIEYVGVVVGHKVADKREADYDRRGPCARAP